MLANSGANSPGAERLPVAAAISREFVTAKVEYFVEVQLWPIKAKLDPSRWLSNFTAAEMNHALHLLNGFLYYPTFLIERLFYANFQSLSMRMAVVQPMRRVRTAWASFVDSVIVTRVTGENPAEVDSGGIFTRMARQVLHLHENQIVAPADAVRTVLDRRGGRVVFLDDFVGSGDQFLATWNREYNINGGEVSFKWLADSLGGVEFFYCPVVCTEYGMSRIRASCPRVAVVSAHVIPRRYSALVDDSVIWPPHLIATGPEFVLSASRRAGIPEARLRGYHNLGLAIAFQHGVPDATLPIFYWGENGWRPLLERT